MVKCSECLLNFCCENFGTSCNEFVPDKEEALSPKSTEPGLVENKKEEK